MKALKVFGCKKKRISSEPARALGMPAAQRLAAPARHPERIEAAEERTEEKRESFRFVAS